MKHSEVFFRALRTDKTDEESLNQALSTAEPKDVALVVELDPSLSAFAKLFLEINITNASVLYRAKNEFKIVEQALHTLVMRQLKKHHKRGAVRRYMKNIIDADDPSVSLNFLDKEEGEARREYMAKRRLSKGTVKTVKEVILRTPYNFKRGAMWSSTMKELSDFSDVPDFNPNED